MKISEYYLENNCENTEYQSFGLSLRKNIITSNNDHERMLNKWIKNST